MASGLSVCMSWNWSFSYRGIKGESSLCSSKALVESVVHAVKALLEEEWNGMTDVFVCHLAPTTQ